jgi:hypothetical protein
VPRSLWPVSDNHRPLSSDPLFCVNRSERSTPPMRPLDHPAGSDQRSISTYIGASAMSTRLVAVSVPWAVPR